MGGTGGASGFSTAQRLLLRWTSFYPPYLGAGIRVERDPSGPTYTTRLKLRWWNRNVFGTHFGGSLYAMCDPFFALILAERLGREYRVLDQAATIRFLRPGRGTVTARFEIPDARVEEIRRLAADGRRLEPVFRTQVRNEVGGVVAEVEKTVYVRRRRGAGEAGEAGEAPYRP